MDRKLLALLTIITLMFIERVNAQTSTLEDTMQYRTFFPQNYGEKRWKFLIGFDAHRSFYNGYPVKFNGIRLGTEFKGVHRFGLGFYGLKKNLEFTEFDINYPDATDSSIVRFNVSYSSLFYKRVLYKTKKWEFAIPTYIAGGTVEGIYQDSSGTFKNFIDQPFSSLGFGIQGKYYIWSWLSPKISIGYRITFNSNKEVKRAFNSPYYAFGVSLSLGELYRALFKKDQVRNTIRTKIDEGAIKEE